MAEPNELRAEVEKLREELDQLKQENSNQTNVRDPGTEETTRTISNVSRRRFLKRAGGGAGMLGAAAMLPNASASQVNSDQALSYYRNDNKDFEVNTEGDITEMGSFATGSAIPLQNGLKTRADITDDNSVTVYNKSKKTVGDGTTTASHQNVNNEVYAKNFPGDDLSAKIQNALDALKENQGRIRITPKDDGTPWQWTQDLSLNLIDRSGAEIDIDDNVLIEYTGSGWCLTVDNTPSVTGGHPGQTSRLRLTGGIWRSTGEDPAGWLKIKDSIGCEIHPNQVEKFRNTAGDSTAISVENHASYSESSHISGRYIANRGIDFVPQSVTGGDGGTPSFHDTYVENVHINLNDFGIRLRGKFDYSTVINPSLFVKSDGGASLVLNTDRAEGTVITGMKCEAPGDPTNAVAVRDDGFDDFYAPTITGGRLDSFGIDAIFESNKSIPFLGQIDMSGEAIQIKNIARGKKTTFDRDSNINSPGGSVGNFELEGDYNAGINNTSGGFFSIKRQGVDFITINLEDNIQSKAPLQFDVQDVSQTGDPGTDRAYVHHDGADGNPEGLYYSDTANSQWVELTGSTTISF